MNLLGEYEFNGSKFFVSLRDIKNEEIFTLISQVHVEDRARMLNGEEPIHPVLHTQAAVAQYFNTGYAVESTKRRKRTGKVFKAGNSGILDNLFELLSSARMYRFASSDVNENVREVVYGVAKESFSAADGNLQFDFEKQDGLYTYLRIRNATARLELTKVKSSLKIKDLKYTELTNSQSKRVMLSSLKKIDYNTLAQTLDMSWYRENGVNKKKYGTVKSNEEFEEVIMTPMLKALSECVAKGEKFHVAMDTETTGLNVYNLAEDNPDKDHCVAIPICWKFGESYVIFTDMKHFQNASNDYVIKRLAQVFELFEGERTVEFWETVSQDEPEGAQDCTEGDGKASFDDLDFSFAETTESQQKAPVQKKVRKTVTFRRDSVNLIGHNSGFDARVFFDLKKTIYFNQDTLQMAFNLNPQSVRGSKKLKVLTRYFFHAETPELDDVLGKGNEDKYRYLEDEEVAAIYGCADADYTFGLFFKLMKLTPERMYHWYQRGDVPMINILAQSEYWGMATIHEEVKKLAYRTKQNIEILKQKTYEYVGVYVKYTNELNILKTKFEGGELSEQEYNAAKVEVKPDYQAVYEFDFKPAQLKHVLYDIMKYKVVAYTDGKGKAPQPKLDKFVVKKLLKYKLAEGEHSFKKLEKDILVFDADEEEYQRLLKTDKKKAESMCLISAKEFNKLRFPLALIVKKYSELNKEYTSYYKPIEEQQLEGKIFKGYNLARIETRRIQNPGQTMKGDLKALVKAYTDSHYLLDFDMSQVEQRIMVSMSGYTDMIERMKDPEKDAHTETASMVEGKPAYMISKTERKNAKHVTFGLPYGLGITSLCEIMFGDTSEEHLIATRIIVGKWMKNNKPIIDLLERAREEALTVWEISDELRDFMGMWEKNDNGEFILDADGNKIPIPIGRVTNLLGFYRVFNLKGIGQTKEDKERRKKGIFTPEEASIRRKSGNYPIQGTASEIFRQILIRFYESCKHYGIADKVKWHMLIHDELLCSVEKDVHPFMLYKIVKEACMITLKGHTNYYIGVNIGDTWAECKDDAREAPIYFVDRMVKRYENGEFEEGWFDHPWEFIKPFRKQYVEDRIGEVIKQYQPNVDNEPVALEALLQKFSNYTVRAYVNSYPINGEIWELPKAPDINTIAEHDNLEWVKRLESWALSYYGEGKEFLGLDGVVYKIHTCEASTPEAEPEELSPEELFGLDGFEEEDTDSYWSWDEDSAEMVYGSEYLVDTEEKVHYNDGSDLEFDLTRTGNNVTDLTIIEKKYNNLKVINKQLYAILANRVQKDLVKAFLKPDVVKLGTQVVFQANGVLEWWDIIRSNYDYKELDAFIDFLKDDSRSLYANGKKTIVKLSGVKEREKLEKILTRYQGDDYNLFICTGSTIVKSVGFSRRVSLTKLENLINDFCA